MIIDDTETTKICLDTILSLLPGHVYWKNKQSIFLGCNDAQAKSAGFINQSQMINKSDYEMPWKDQADEIRKNDLEIMQDRKISTKEEKSRLSDGREAIFLSQKVPLLNNKNEVIGLLGISLDITELKKTQNELAKIKKELEKANDAQLNLLSLINHEARNPMHVVLGEAQLLLHKKLNDYKNKEDCYNNMKDAAKKIYDHADDFMKIINYLYDFVEQEVSNDPSPKNEIDLPKTLELAAKEFHDIFLKKQIDFNIEYIGEIPEIILINYRKFRHIVSSLIKSALKRTNSGFITMEVVVLHDKKQNNQADLKISVKDTGHYISEQQIKHIFEHLDNQKNKSYIDSDLELSACKKRVEILGGKIGIKSEAELGTESWVKIPFLYSKENKHFIKGKKKLNILVVEDNKICAEIVKNMLLLHDCKVDIALNGEAASNLLKSSNIYDLVFLDIMLPDINGCKLIPIIKKSSPNKNIPVIAITSQVMESDKEQCLKSGIDDIFYKPIYFNDIREILDRYGYCK